MSVNLSIESKTEATILYLRARAATLYAMCSANEDGDEYSESEMFYKLRSALYDITGMLLTLHDVPVVESLAERIAGVRRFCGDNRVPSECVKMLAHDEPPYGARFADVGQTLDCWIVMLGNKYAYAVKDICIQHLVHSMVS